MIMVFVLVPERAVVASIADPAYLFNTVNGLLRASGKRSLFHIRLVGASRKVKLQEGAFTVHTDLLLHETAQAELIVIPSLVGDMNTALRENAELLPWLVRQYKGGAELASLSMGTFLLAATGLLRNLPCSTHWSYASQFRHMFPDVALISDKIVTGQRGLYSSGGANSYWNLLLQLVEKFTDREMAILVSKHFSIEMDRDDQLPFIIFTGEKDHGDEIVQRAQEYIEHHFREKITVEELSVTLGLIRRTFERRFKRATSNTVIEYIQRVKIEAAKKQLEAGRRTVEEVMRDVGYTDVKAFRDVFRRISGLSPIDYRNRYNNKAAV